MNTTMDTVKVIAIIFCMIFAIIISITIWGEWQDYKQNNMPNSLIKRIEANTSYIEKNQSVAIPADGYLAFSNKKGDYIIIVDPKKLSFYQGKEKIHRY